MIKSARSHVSAARAEPVIKAPTPASTKHNSAPAHGNQAAQRLLAVNAIQAKLTVSQPDDPAEREADRMADQVMRMPMGKQPGCAACEQDDAPCASCRAKQSPAVQRKATPGSDRSSLEVGNTRLELGSAEPLDADTRAFFEPRFGQDFSGVRIHTDARAAASARQIEALAFTAGRDIAFAAGAYAPQTQAGRHLLAHELTHVVQQGAAPVPTVQRRAVIGERPAPDALDFDALADELFAAMDIWGTDEEAVYAALQQLNLDPTAIDTLKQRYQARHGTDLVAEIVDEFSEEELEYALQLLGMGRPGSPQDIVAPSADLAAEVQRLVTAMDWPGTDEEAVFAVLLPFNRATQALETAYRTTVGRSLREDIIDEMSTEELDYAMSLLSFDADYFLGRYFDAAQRPAARLALDEIFAATELFTFRDDRALATEIRSRLDLRSPRLSGNPLFESVLDGLAVIATGDSGPEVRRVQQLLIDLGISMPVDGANGTFGAETETAVKEFQRTRTPPLPEDGRVDSATLRALDGAFPRFTLPAGRTNPWSMPCVLDILCPWNKPMVENVLPQFNITTFDSRSFPIQTWDGSTWVGTTFNSGGFVSGTNMGFLNTVTCQGFAMTVYHEGWHGQQPSSLTGVIDTERDAYINTEQWTIALGIPGQSFEDENTGAIVDLRDTLAGETVVDATAAETLVRQGYGGVSSTPGERILQRVGASNVRVRRADGTEIERPAAVGESVRGAVTMTNQQSIDPADWDCP